MINNWNLDGKSEGALRDISRYNNIFDTPLANGGIQPQYHFITSYVFHFQV